MSDIDYGLLAGNAGGEPTDGIYAAMLVRLELVHTQSGSRLVSEWQVSAGTPYYWTTWFGFAANRIGVTQDFLDGLGVDRSRITDDESFELALHQVVGRMYEVRTESWSGGVNTFIESVVGSAGSSARPPSMDDDLAPDTRGLPDLTPASVGQAALPDDDDIPF
jgi:hypothetical protein